MKIEVLHEANHLPDGDWVVARGKKNEDELFVQSRKTGGRLCRMWNGAPGRDAVARLFASSKGLLDAAEKIIALPWSEFDLENDEIHALLELQKAVNQAKGVERDPWYSQDEERQAAPPR